MANNELPELMTVKQLKEYLHCGNDTAYGLCRRKDFPSFRINDRFYIKKSDLAKWIERQSVSHKY